jgi:hypothetical protein
LYNHNRGGKEEGNDSKWIILKYITSV